MVVGSMLEQERARTATFQDAMRRIQQATGILDINTVPERLFGQKQRRLELEEEIASALAELDGLQKELHDAQEQRRRI